VAAKYDSGAEAEVRSWFQSLLNEELQPGMRQFEDQLRNGQLLCKLVKLILFTLASQMAIVITE